MKPLCFVKQFGIMLFLLVGTLHASSLDKKSAMLYYGDDISWSLVGIHDYIIVQPDHIDTATHGFKLYKKQVYAYLSVGEVEKEQKEYSKVDSSWVLGENKIWKSKVLDIANPDYQAFFFEHTVAPLYKKGFRNFFLDTLDSWHLVTKREKERARMRQGLVALINTFHQRYPQSKLILNRGFEVIDTVHDKIEAVLFESLFNGLSGKDHSYSPVSSEDRAWLKKQIDKIKSYHLPVIVADYLPLDQKEKIQKNIKQIETLGAIPYIGDRHLMRFGYSSKQAIKREVLLLYDDTQFDGTESDDKIYSTVFLQLSMPLEYMGYIPILKPITQWKLRPRDADRYAGVVIWINGTYAEKYPADFTKQIRSLYKSPLKLLIMESLILEKHKSLSHLLSISSFKLKENKSSKKMKIIYNKSDMGFEIKPLVSVDTQLYLAKNATPLCMVQRGKQKGLLAAITPWGGFAFDGSILASINSSDIWIANPFTLLRKTLRLSDIPAPDVTTENGRRLLFSHIDGDGIVNRVEWNPDLFSGDTIYDEILSKYKMPISVSIVEAETAPYGLYPKLSPQLESLARKMYQLPNVEAATHTFSHPFYWGQIRNDRLDPKYRLDVKDYTFSIDRELRGSLEYINEKLEPKGKKARTIFWTGDCLPTESTLAYVYQNDFLQINGGDTIITNNDPWLSLVAPLGIKRGNYYQVFAGAQNENVYTNNWHGPYWGFKKVIQTFELTGKPRRLKPIDIYYHFYTGSKRASLKALHTVYRWALEQETTPIYTSVYIPKVMDYFAISIAQEGNEWLVRGTESLKTLRVPSAQYPDYKASPDIAGDKQFEQSRYLHLDTKSQQRFRLSDREDTTAHLIDANGLIDSFERKDKKTKLTLKAHVPLRLRLKIPQGCSYQLHPTADTKKIEDDVVTLTYQTRKDANVSLSCE